MRSSQILVLSLTLWFSGPGQTRTLGVKKDPLGSDPQALTWKFPEDPVAPVQRLPPAFRVQTPEVRRDRVGLRCGQSRIQVEVSQDLLGLGRLVRPRELTLGGCPAVEVDPLARVLVFEAELQDCGSRLVMTEDSFIYAFVLVYQPKALGTITRTQRVLVGVECHYLR